MFPLRSSLRFSFQALELGSARTESEEKAILVCESGLFLKKGPNFLGRHGPILRLTFYEAFFGF